MLVSLVAWTGDSDRAQAQSPSVDAPAGTKRALMIGINKYKAVPKLQGSLNDIETMRQILLTRWGFADKNITVVTDEAATRAGMLAALEQLAKDAGPNDTIYFHYSGHGSQVEDLNGDEPDDHLDETLVPQDGRTVGVMDITDDELDAIFSRMPVKNAFIVLDSCHSGTATRSLDIRTRSIPQDNRIDIYKKAEDAKPKTRAIVPVVTSRYVVMTGAASHQEALDGPVEGRYHGFFSYALSKSLSSTPVGATPREIFRGVEVELKRIQTHFGRASMPEPQLEAPPDLLERPLLGTTGNAPSRLAWVEVKPAATGTITLVNGFLLGAAPGSTWAIYPPGDTTFTPGRALAIATVTHLDGQHAQAKLNPAGKTIQDRSRAVAFLPASTGEKIPVHLLDVPSSQRKQIEQMLQKQIPNLELVGPEQAPRYMVSTQGSTIQLLAADGIQLVGSFDRDGDGWATGVAMVVSRSAHASELLTLDNPSSQLKIDLRVANAPAPGKPKVGTRGIAVVAADTQPAHYRIRKPGKPRTAENTLQLQVKVNADAYISIVDVDSEGGVNLLFPNDYAKPSFYPEGFVKGGEIVLIPDSLHDSNRAGFYWDYSPPKGMDTVRVFSSTDLETAQMIRQRIKELQASASKTPGKISTRAIGESIDSIREDLTKRATRGIVTVSDQTNHQPGPVSAGPSTEPGLPPLAIPSNQPDIVATPEPMPPTPAGPAPDWAATSITIKVEG